MVGNSIASVLHERSRYYTIKLYAVANRVRDPACYRVHFINYSWETYDDSQTMPVHSQRLEDNVGGLIG